MTTKTKPSGSLQRYCELCGKKQYVERIATNLTRCTICGSKYYDNIPKPSAHKQVTIGKEGS